MQVSKWFFNLSLEGMCIKCIKNVSLHCCHGSYNCFLKIAFSRKKKSSSKDLSILLKGAL